MTTLWDGLRGLGAGRLVALSTVAVVMMSLLGVLAIRGNSENLSLLYADLELQDSARISELLTRQKIPFELAQGGTQVSVSSEQVAKVRLLLAKENLPTGGSVGYEIFDRGDALTANQFQQAVNQLRALEGEIARTIRGIKGVKSVRVHLVLPKREAFSKDRQDAQASIQLAMNGNSRLDNEGIRSVLNLVAAAVPGLRVQNISLTDTRGTLLARSGDPHGPLGAMQNNTETRIQEERRIARAVQDMLERSFGTGHVHAEASIDFDYEQIRETQERYDPEQQVIRSSQSVTNSSKTTEQAAGVSVQNNLPGAETSSAGAGNQEQRQEETTNYEIAKTIRTTVRDQPKLARVSIAVMVDGINKTNPDGSVTWVERPVEDIERISRLVRGAIGFDDKRGDRVDIVSFRFLSEPEDPSFKGEPNTLFGMEQSSLIRFLTNTLYIALFLLGLFFISRPISLSLTDSRRINAASSHSKVNLMSPGQAAVDGINRTSSLAHDGSLALLSGPTAPGLAYNSTVSGMLDDESMVNIANVEGQLRASSIRRIADLVEKHPEESLSIVRGWMQQEAS